MLGRPSRTEAPLFGAQASLGKGKVSPWGRKGDSAGGASWQGSCVEPWRGTGAKQDALRVDSRGSAW